MAPIEIRHSHPPSPPAFIQQISSLLLALTLDIRHPPSSHRHPVYCRRHPQPQRTPLLSTVDSDGLVSLHHTTNSDYFDSATHPISTSSLPTAIHSQRLPCPPCRYLSLPQSSPFRHPPHHQTVPIPQTLHNFDPHPSLSPFPRDHRRPPRDQTSVSLLRTIVTISLHWTDWIDPTCTARCCRASSVSVVSALLLVRGIIPFEVRNQGLSWMIKIKGTSDCLSYSTTFSFPSIHSST